MLKEVLLGETALWKTCSAWDPWQTRWGERRGLDVDGVSRDLETSHIRSEVWGCRVGAMGGEGGVQDSDPVDPTAGEDLDVE